jgi:hypothetical protein
MSICGLAEPFGIITSNGFGPLVLAFAAARYVIIGIPVIVTIFLIREKRVREDSDNHNKQYKKRW